MLDELEDWQAPRALVVSGANRSSVLWIVSEIARSLRDAGWRVEIGNAVTGGLPPPPDYDAIVIVVSAWARWRAIAQYVEWFRDSLAELPVVIVLAGTRIDADRFCARALRFRPSIAFSVENSSCALRTATRVATELIALHARAKLTA